MVSLVNNQNVYTKINNSNAPANEGRFSEKLVRIIKMGALFFGPVAILSATVMAVVSFAFIVLGMPPAIIASQQTFALIGFTLGVPATILLTLSKISEAVDVFKYR